MTFGRHDQDVSIVLVLGVLYTVVVEASGTDDHVAVQYCTCTCTCTKHKTQDIIKVQYGVPIDRVELS
jgi:hypothetical protein